MESLLKKYQSRIINISKRNRSLVLNKIYKKRAFDLVDLDNIYLHKATEIFEALVFNKKSGIEILPSAQSFSKKYYRYIKKIENELNNVPEFNYDTVKRVVEEYFFDISYVLQDAYANINELILDLRDQIVFKTELIEQYDYALQTLFYEVDFERKETGIHNLKLAVNFVEGKFNPKDSFCRAPLGYISVSINKKNKRWFIHTLDESNIVANDVFLFSARLNNNLDNKEDNIFELKSRQAVISELIEYYKINDIDILNFDKIKLKKLNNYTAKDYKKYQEGELFYKGYFVIGQFPTANAIYHDYNDLLELCEQGELANNSLQILLGDKEANMPQNGDSDSLISSEFVDKKYYYINRLDYSQELTLKKCNDYGSLVVFGPPGTGKSQTITNIVADCMAKGKKVLVVSQKKAALDVIYNRLSSIQDKICLIHDSHNDRSQFYKKTTATLERFEARYPKDFHYKNKREHYCDENEERLRNKLFSTSKSIDETVNDISSINKFLFTSKYSGFTGKEMYANAFSNFDLDNNKKELFNNFLLLIESIPAECFSKANIGELHNELNADNYMQTKYELESLLQQHTLVNNLNKKSVPRLVQSKIMIFNKINDLLGQYSSLIASNNECKIVSGFINTNNIYDDLNTSLNDNIKQYLAKQYPQLLQPVATGANKFFRSIFAGKKLKQEQQDRHSQYQTIFNSFMKAKDQLLGCLNQLKHYVTDVLQLFTTEFGNNLLGKLVFSKISIKADNLQLAVNQLPNYNKYIYKLNSLSNYAKGIVTACYQKLNDFNKSVMVIKNLKRLMTTFVLESLQHTDFFTQINSHIEKYNSYLGDVNTKITEKHLYSQYYINVYWNNVFLKTAHDYDYREFRRLAALKRRVRPLRVYFSEFKELVISLYPCMLMGPKTVSEVLPLAAHLFDTIIFDEASQMFIEDAIPTIFRGEHVVIAGDDKQLKPTMTFRKKYDDENTTLSKEFAAASEEESLLDLAKHKFIPSQLQFHYRSRYSQLINFSNHAFYEGNLQISPNRIEDYNNPPIERIKVENGLWKDRENIEEAKVVVNKVKQILISRKNQETIGIITFNITQRNCILDLLSIEANKNDNFEQLFNEEIIRKKGDEDVSLFVKNIENVQGDERDIIIFSTGYAKDTNGKFRHQFGDLSKDSGENRLNVAITRAKQKVYIITSFEPEQLNIDNSKNLGPKRFKQYLQYAKLVSLGKYKLAEEYLKVTFSREHNTDELHFDSPFEEEVYDELLKLGYNVKSQVGVNGYRIDLAIYDANIASYILGIECDGVSFHGTINARQRDIHRQKFLESRGWCIHRIWSNRWWYNREEELKKVVEAVNNCYANKSIEE
ncbi:AAA family ATPase [Clostridium sp. 'deep sea']|uniref:AAA domain-containing protein n=1 Tax=Clostridium sp. 'deep sea' TaxID=2779445 RepID=UPI0018968E12|nr:AAA domain-containing protein [Clostridium sp. 'deep sea']QOR35991.1 AAA family ATPase [Clostridium sp. 'deep sea']